MTYAERVSFAFGQDDSNAKYGVFEILGDTNKLISSGKKSDCENAKKKLVEASKAKIPKYVVRKLSNLWNFGDLENAETKWTPPDNLFAEGSAKKIADEVHKSHDSLKSAIACLNFYLNRGGENISKERKDVIEEAKEKIREMYKEE